MVKMRQIVGNIQMDTSLHTMLLCPEIGVKIPFCRAIFGQTLQKCWTYFQRVSPARAKLFEL